VETVRVGVVGVGAMGQLFARLLTELPNARVCGVADRLVERAETIGRRFKVPAFPSVEDLLDEIDVDSVIIATADDQHVGPVSAAARAGKSILLEKPLATTVADGRMILKAVTKAGVPLMVGHCVRFDPRYAATKTAIGDGKLGQLIHLTARRTSRLVAHRHIFGRCSVSMFLGVHDLDYMLWATGRGVKKVCAVGHRQTLEGVDTHASVLSLLEFDDGTIGTLETCWAAPLPSWQFQAVGTKGMVTITSPEDSSMLYSLEGLRVYNPLYSADPVAEGQTLNVYQAELMHFLHCVAHERPFIVQPQEALVAVAVAEAIDRSVASGQAEVPEDVAHER
jgi:UDP-N-acetylglucosamine 3-dehydrogenase